MEGSFGLQATQQHCLVYMHDGCVKVAEGGLALFIKEGSMHRESEFTLWLPDDQTSAVAFNAALKKTTILSVCRNFNAGVGDNQLLRDLSANWVNLSKHY